MVDTPQKQVEVSYVRRPVFYDQWMETQGIPIYRDYYIEDGRTIELGHWEARGHDAAFLQLAGQEGVSEARISEIKPGATIKPYKFALEEEVYVLQGRGVATITLRRAHVHNAINGAMLAELKDAIQGYEADRISGFCCCAPMVKVFPPAPICVAKMTIR